MPLRDVAGQQAALDLLNGARDLNPARARLGAVEDGAAAPDARLLVQHGQPVGCTLVAAVVDEAVGVDDRRGTDEFVVGPGDRAGTGAAGAEDALRRVVEALAILR